MKKIFSIITLSLILCINVNAEIITLRNCEKTYDSVNGYEVSGSFMTFTIDTKKKRINLQDDGSYGGINLNFKIISGSIDDGLVSEHFNISGNSLDKGWYDEVILYPKKSSATYISWGKKLFKKESKKVRHWRVRCEHSSYKEIAEKPKKQEPLEEIVSLSNSVWQTDIDDALYEFFTNGSCQYTAVDLWKRTFTNCRWEQNKNNIKWILDGGNFIFKGQLNGKRFSGKWKNEMTGKTGLGSGYAETITAWISKPNKKDPEKKKPKPSPDDDKIVPAGSGSGFFVSKDGHAITNYHVIEGCDINKLSFKGSQTEVKVLAVDKVNDIAILKSNAKPDVIFPVSNEDVSLLEDVIVAGFPLGKQISSAIKTHKGVVTALAGAGDNYSFFQTDAAINQGNSGGPIINQKGNVVGIAVATWVEEGVQGVHFGIKSSTLKTFASANGLSFASPNYRDLSNKDLGKLITKGTVYVECHMTLAKIKKMIAQAENRKAFFKEHK